MRFRAQTGVAELGSNLPATVGGVHGLGFQLDAPVGRFDHIPQGLNQPLTDAEIAVHDSPRRLLSRGVRLCIYSTTGARSGQTTRRLLARHRKARLLKSLGDKGSGLLVIFHDHAADGEDGLHLSFTEPYDAAVIDIMLPKLGGLRLIEGLRREKISTPVIILSARRSVDDRVTGLQTGSDDYLTKPFAFAELLARVQALTRRANQTPEPTRPSVAYGKNDLLFES